MVSSKPAETFRVIDRRTGKPVGGVYQSSSRARARRDALDLRYGAIRYAVQRAQA